jgi:protease-4
VVVGRDWNWRNFMENRTVLWIFLAFILGFILPVCSCAGIGLMTLTAMGQMAGEPTMPVVGSGDAVAVIDLNGVIMSNQPQPSISSQMITPERVENLLDQAAGLDQVKAVVVQVNSPGGSVVASDEIYHMLLDFEKPVVIWMGETAASGGFYISCAGDYVYTHPDTLTGSIGVITQFINAEEFLDENGIEAVVITSGPHKDMGSLFRGMTEEEREIWNELIDQVYDNFVEVVVEARDLPDDTVRELADGRIYTGQQALEHGLVDDVGLPSDALDKAAELGGIEGEPQVIELKAEPSFYELLYGLQSRASLLALEDVLSWAGVPTMEYRFVGP